MKTKIQNNIINICNCILWSFVSVSAIVLILTLLVTYHFVFIQVFDTYSVLQITMSITLFLFGIRTLYDKKTLHSKTAMIFFTLAFSLITFYHLGVR